MPRLLPVLVVVLAFAGCSRKTEPASDAPAAPPSAAPVAASPIEATAIDAGVDDNPLDWTTLSADAKTELEQKGKPDGSCVLTARRDGKTLWSGDCCLAKRADMRFLSKDGERFVVKGARPERWIKQTDFTNDEAVGYLADRLNRLGVETALEKAGAQPGAEVVVGDVSFDYEPGMLAGAEHRIGPRGTDSRLDGR